MPDHDTVIVHGTTIALGSRAALIRGPSGSGKSDLALRCISLPQSSAGQLALIADDQTVIGRLGNTLVASAPQNIAGLLEIRGLGIVPVPFIEHATLHLIIDLVPADTMLERYPGPLKTTEILGLSVPLLHLKPFESSAAAKVLFALSIENGRLAP